MYCKNCGNELKDEEKVCSKCGFSYELETQTSMLEKTDEDEIVIKEDNSNESDTNITTKKKKGLIIAITVCAVVIIIGLFAVWEIFYNSVDNLCSRGNYEKAYNRANDEEKVEVLAENAVAVVTEDTSDSIDTPSSFKLEKAYYFSGYSEDDNEIVAEAVIYWSARSNGGTKVKYYCIYIYNNDDEKYDIRGIFPTLNQESDDSLWTVLMKALASAVIGSQYSIELTDSQIDRINAFYDEDMLDEIELIDYDTVDSSLFEADEEELEEFNVD